MGYGDTVPSTGFIAAGMTFEKASGDPAPRRVYEQYLTQWVSLSAASARKQELLTAWHGGVRRGRPSRAGPASWSPTRSSTRATSWSPRCPTGRCGTTSCAPTTRPRRPRSARMVRRLQRMDVAGQATGASRCGCRTTRRTHRVGALDRAAGGDVLGADGAGAEALGAGDAQRGHVHAVPVLLRRDRVEQPAAVQRRRRLLGRVLRPLALPHPAGLRAAPPLGRRRARRRSAVFQLDTGTARRSSRSGWLRWLLEKKWRLPYREVTAASIAAGGLSDVDVLLVPNGSAAAGFRRARVPPARAALASWVRAGGRYVGWRGGTELAALLGISTARARRAHLGRAGQPLPGLRRPAARSVGASGGTPGRSTSTTG